MNEIVAFNFNGADVRTLTKDGNPWWVAKDVCDVLGLSNITEALAGLDRDELTSVMLKSGGQGREMKIINEAGLYSLILRSRKPEARTFKRWITHEVLPTLRKTGSYTAPETKKAMTAEMLKQVRLSVNSKIMTIPEARAYLGIEEMHPKEVVVSNIGELSPQAYAVEMKAREKKAQKIREEKIQSSLDFGGQR